MSIQETKNLEYCKKALSLKVQIEVTYLQLGEMLYNIKEKNLFEPQWSSFHEYTMEFRLPDSTVSKLINIYRRFILEYGFSPTEMGKVGWSVLAETLPYVKSKKEAKYWFGKAVLLNQKDLRREIIEVKTGIQIRDCKHEESYVIRICPKCGDRERVYEK